MKKNNKGFTLVELLAILVILAIIMGVAIPAIFRTIEKSRKSTFKQTVEGIARSALIENKSNPSGAEETTYRYKNADWTNNYLEVDGKVPKYIEIKVKEDNQIRYAITDGRYCATKEYDSEITVKKISDENNDTMVEEQYCVLDAVIGTSIDCFETKENSDGTLTITKYYKNEGNKTKNPVCPKNVTIPNKIDGKKITIIGQNAFSQQLLTSVVMPNTITKIESGAFMSNNLKEIIIPEGVTSIGQNAFYNCNAQNLSLPTTLVSISANAFRGNKLPQEQAYIYKRNSDGSIDYTTIIAYGGASKTIEIPGEKNGVKLTTIGSQAFAQHSLTSIVIPNTVKTIESGAFMSNNLKEVIIPEGVTTIGQNAFYNCNIENLSLPSTLVSVSADAFRGNKLSQEQGYLYKRNNDGSIDYTTIMAYAGESKIIEIPGEKNGIKLTSIGAQAFSQRSLTKVVIPNTVKTIESGAFMSNNLKEVIIPEGVTTIGQNAFYNCNIESLRLPSTLVSIAANAFRGNKLPQDQAYIYKRNSAGSIDYTTIIAYGGESKAIEIPSEKNGVKLTVIGAQAFTQHSLTSVVIPNTVKTIESGAFMSNNLKEVIIPEGVTSIGQNAFYNSNVESLRLPTTLTSISANAFRSNKLPQDQAYIYKRNSDGSIDYSTIIGYGGTNKAIEIPNEKNGVKLIVIGAQAFAQHSLTSVVIPNTVRIIESGAFMNNNLKEVIIPEGVTSISTNVFYGNSLTSVTIKNNRNNVTIASNAFGEFSQENIKWKS